MAKKKGGAKMAKAKTAKSTGKGGKKPFTLFTKGAKPKKGSSY